MIDDNTRGWSSVRLGVELTPDEPLEEVIELAQQAEANDIDAIFVSNHYDNRDSLAALAAIATATERVLIGPGVVNPYETHPVRLATAIATLDELSDGRAVFGLGAGDRSTLGALGIEHNQPVRRVRETIEVIRRLLAGEQVDHGGTFEARAASLNFGARPVPMLVGAQGPLMLQMSAEYADGILLNAAHPRDYRWASGRIDAGLVDRPDQRGPLRLAGFASVSVAEDRDDARNAARAPVAFITAGAPDGVIERHDIDPDRVEETREALSAGRRDRAYELVTPAMIDAFCVAGDPETVGDRLLDLLEFADAIIAASPLGPDRHTAVTLLGEITARLRTQRGWVR